MGFCLGFKLQNLCINPMGLSIKFKINSKDFNKKFLKANRFTIKKILIALAGPVVNFIIALVFIFNNSDFLGLKNELIIYANLLIAVFNLIPIYPLDGGRVIKHLIQIFKGLEVSNTYMNIISNISIVILTFFSSIGIFYLKNISILFIVTYLWYLVITENKLYNQRLKMYEVLNNSELDETKKENVNL
jgi:stage IV sporulation protein FB